MQKHELVVARPDAALRRDLRERLLSLNYHALTWVVTHLLEQLGYADVRPAGRTGYFGRNSQGGYDLEALLPFALGQRRVLVQVKQFDAQAVFRRNVDELRGACLRTGAAEGVIVSTGPVAPSLSCGTSVDVSAPATPGIAPVQLVGREELVDLLLLHSIGVLRSDTADGREEWRIDDTYFKGLERYYSGTGRGKESAAHPPHFLLTVGVQRIGKKLGRGRVTRMVV